MVMVTGRELSRLLSRRPRLGLIDCVGNLTSPFGIVLSLMSSLTTDVTGSTECGHQIVMLLIRNPTLDFNRLTKSFG